MKGQLTEAGHSQHEPGCAYLEESAPDVQESEALLHDDVPIGDGHIQLWKGYTMRHFGQRDVIAIPPTNSK